MVIASSSDVELPNPYKPQRKIKIVKEEPVSCGNRKKLRQFVGGYRSDCLFRSHPRHSLSNNNRDDILEKFFQPIKNPRRQLPSDQIHGGGISLWDLAKRSIPIHAFEPLSVLQAICEELRFADRFLNKLYDTKEADQRMIMVIGFIVSGYTCLVGRNRKPVNPILGETFDFISKDGWKYHAEQAGFICMGRVFWLLSSG